MRSTSRRSVQRALVSRRCTRWPSAARSCGFLSPEAGTSKARDRMPVLVIWGTRDQLVNPGALNDYRAVPAAHIVQIDGAGHSATIERPRDTAKLILGWR
jgi:pimeloyl-ACP methyl ester carboxylesterase